MTTSIDDFRQKLETFISGETGSAVSVGEMRQLAGGASRESWAFDATIDGIAHKLVLRRDLPTSMHDEALTRAQEFRVMQVAHEHGVRVAKVRWQSDDPSALGSPFFIMDYVEGISIGRKVITTPELEHARDVLPEQLAEQLAIIHAIDPAAHGLDFLPGWKAETSPAEGVVANSYAVLDELGAHIPAFEFALRWAEQNAPTRRPTMFVHGDFRIGNMLVDQNGLAAVIDWEFAHIGDPLEEIGYICMRDWRFGNDHLHMGGLCERERFIKAYERHSGRRVDRGAVDWWEIMGNIRWGIICLAQADRHLSGRDPSVELASLGRRSAEMQLEALRLIEKVGI